MDLETKRKLAAYKRGAGATPEQTQAVKAEVSGAEAVKDEEGRPEGWREKAGAFAKIPARQAPGGPDGDGGSRESKARKVAKFLILIGPDQAAKVLANLDEDQVESISREIADIRGITKEEASEIFAEFQGLLSSSLSSGGAAGGLEEARRLLYAAFGPEKGEAFLRRSVPDVKETSFSFLEDFSGEQVAMLLRDELPATGAVILSRISASLAAKALACAEPAWRLETVRRIGRLGKISPEALEKTASVLREKARSISGLVTSDVDGMGALAAILKHSAVSFGDRILNELSDEDPDLSSKLKERLYTLDDVVKAENKPIQQKLREMDIRDIAVLVKGREGAFTEKILSNISTRRRAEVEDELRFMGLISKKDSDAAIKSFMDWFRNERESGQILMLGDELVS
ncbi:MAG: flagellar motor switch protein FliG [Spirochaetaceae bacterium]|jgi:flagellar motor switch protein FliG|nr:flagellar motor switch protein FliG [Spirochaetaceae bacterium]